MTQSRTTLLSLTFVFLRLGCCSFGGPVAHLAYFHEEFVRRRKWLSESDYNDLIAFCHFLPGASSSQVNYAVGFSQRGWIGGVLAWVAFTLPSAILMILFALSISQVDPSKAGWIAGMKMAAVAVIAKAIWEMAKKLDGGKISLSLLFLSAIMMLLFAGAGTQLVIIILGALAGALLFSSDEREAKQLSEFRLRVSRRTGIVLLVVFFGLLAVPSVLETLSDSSLPAIFDAFYRSGALVFGGGHLVLPLLEQTVVSPGWVNESVFLSGYGAAQAVPGPLFSFAAFLGASIHEFQFRWVGGIFCLAAIFLPSLLLVTGLFPFWSDIRRFSLARRALKGCHAAIVGLLLAAFLGPIWGGTVTSPEKMAFALCGFLLLQIWKVPSWALVVTSAFAGWLFL